MKMVKAVIILIFILFKGCSDGVVNNNPVNENLQEIRFTNSLQNAIIYTNPANILIVRIEGDVLTMRIEYTGGCEVHDFELYSLTSFKESYPVQLDMRLSHNANGDNCDRLVTDTLYFNLKPVKNLFIKSYGMASGEIYLNINDPSMQVFDPPPLYRF